MVWHCLITENLDGVALLLCLLITVVLDGVALLDSRSFRWCGIA